MAISPARVTGRRCVVPWSKTSRAVTVSTAAVSLPRWTRSRVRNDPANMRTKAIFSPFGARSILNTVPDAGLVASPARRAAAPESRGGGRRRRRPSTPHRGRPGRSGRATWSASRAPSRSGGIGDPSRRPPGSASSPAASRSSTAAANTGSVRSCAVNPAPPVPTPRTEPSPTRWRRGGRRRPPAPRHVGAHPVDLVDEDDRGHAEPTQGPEQQQRLRLHALDGRHDQDGSVEHAEHALDLGDEVGVSRCVDEVDRHAVDHEGHDGGLDRDAPLAFQRQRIGLGGAVVDATDLVDDPGRVQQPFGEGGLTGVDVRQDPDVRCRHVSSRPSDRHVPDR